MKPNYLFICFLSFLIWIPLPLGSNRDWSAMLICICIALLSLGWLVLYIKGEVQLTQSFKKAFIIIFLLAVAQLYILYQLYADITIDAETTFKELLLGTSLTLFFCICLLIIDSSYRIKAVIYTLVFSGLLQSIYGSLMTLSELEYSFFLKKESYLGVVTGTFINRNHLAGYLIICLSLGMGIMISKLRVSHQSFKKATLNFLKSILDNKALLRISLIIMVAALVMTHSRMGNFAFFMSLGVIGTLTLLSNRRSFKSTIILFISLLIIDITIVGTFFGVEKVIDRIEATSIQKESRDEVNLYSIKIINDNLLLGTGAGSFYTAFPQVREKEVGFLFYDHAHNDYIEFLAERGVIGTAPLLLVVVITFFIALKALFKRHRSLMRGCAFGCLMSMLAMAIHALVDFNLQIPANAVAFILVLSLGWISLFYKTKH